MLQNLDYQRFCAGRYLMFQRLLSQKGDGVVIKFITSVYCVLFVDICIIFYLVRSASGEFYY